MKQPPANQLDPRVRNVWRINDAIWIVAIFVCLAITPLILTASPSTAGIATTLLAIVGICFVVVLVVWLIVLPPIRYARWRYEVCGKEMRRLLSGEVGLTVKEDHIEIL